MAFYSKWLVFTSGLLFTLINVMYMGYFFQNIGHFFYV